MDLVKVGSTLYQSTSLQTRLVCLSVCPDDIARRRRCRCCFCCRCCFSCCVGACDACGLQAGCWFCVGYYRVAAANASSSSFGQKSRCCDCSCAECDRRFVVSRSVVGRVIGDWLVATLRDGDAGRVVACVELRFCFAAETR